jgi:hypothetical protein
MTTRRWGWLLVSSALLALAGCIKLDQTLTLNADGSGSLRLRYGMSEDTIAQWEAMEQMAVLSGQRSPPKRHMPLDFDLGQVRAELDAHRTAGVGLTTLSSEVVEGWRFIDLEVAFEDVRALKRVRLFKGSRLAIRPMGRDDYRITQEGGASARLWDDAAGRQLLEQIPGMLAGLRVVQTLVVPGDIIATNAPRVEGRRATWVFDIEADPDVMNTLTDTDLALTFEGRGLRLPTLSP